MLPDTPPSRASSLPQGFSVVFDISDDVSPMWERACSRRGRHIQHQYCLAHRLREQARSHRDCGVQWDPRPPDRYDCRPHPCRLTSPGRCQFSDRAWEPG